MTFSRRVDTTLKRQQKPGIYASPNISFCFVFLESICKNGDLKHLMPNMWQNKSDTHEKYLLSCPERHGFKERGRQELHSADLVRQASVDQRSVLIPCEKTATDGHVGARHHVVLNQACQWLPILQKVQRTVMCFPQRQTIPSVSIFSMKTHFRHQVLLVCAH